MAARSPGRAKVDAYPAVEKYGIVFAFLGDLPADERPSLLEVPEWDQPGWRANTVTTLDLNYYYEQGWGMWFLHRFDSLDPKHDGSIHARNKVIAQQDIDILENVYPRRTPLSNTREVLMPADKAVVAFRQWLANFDDHGWRIDWAEFTRRNGRDTAFAITAPRRREGGNWVVEAVPLMANRESRRVGPPA